MKLWLVERAPWGFGETPYDQATKMVVRAASEWDARVAAVQSSYAGQTSEWLNKATVTEIPAEGEPAVILEHVLYS